MSRFFRSATAGSFLASAFMNFAFGLSFGFILTGVLFTAWALTAE